MENIAEEWKNITKSFNTTNKKIKQGVLHNGNHFIRLSSDFNTIEFKNNKFHVRIKIDGKIIKISSFDNMDDAVSSYHDEIEKRFGPYANSKRDLDNFIFV